MTISDRLFEERLAAWYGGVDQALWAPEGLRDAVLALPDARRPSLMGWLALPWVRMRAVVIVGALVATLVGVAVAGGAGILRLAPTHRVPTLPGGVDACDILVAAFGPNAVPNGKSGDHGITVWGGHVCVNDGWDGGWNDRHLFYRTVTTSREEAGAIIDDPANWAPEEDGKENPSLEAGSWVEIGSGVWVGQPRVGERYWAAIAVSRDPVFFIATGRSESQALETARAIAARLGLEIDVDPSWPMGSRP